MRILHIINNLNIGGAETLLCDLAHAQSKCHSVIVATLSDTPSILKQKLENLGIKTISFDANRFSPLNAIRIRKLMSGIDVVHAHLFPSFYWTALASAIIPKQKKPVLIHTVHSTFSRRKNILFKLCDNWCLNRFDIIAAISKSTHDNLALRYPKILPKLRIVENGIDLHTIQSAQPLSRSELNCSADNKIIVQVANFRIQKDQATLVKALQYLPDTYIAVFAGDGITLNQTKQLAEDIGVIDRCRFIGQCSYIPQLLKTSDIVVMSSKWEGFGLAAVEGMTAAKPVIASDIDGLKKVVDGYGLLFQCGNVDDLVKNILSLENKNYYDLVVGKCVKRAAMFDIINTHEAYERLYCQKS